MASEHRQKYYKKLQFEQIDFQVWGQIYCYIHVLSHRDMLAVESYVKTHYFLHVQSI